MVAMSLSEGVWTRTGAGAGEQLLATACTWVVPLDKKRTMERRGAVVFMGNSGGDTGTVCLYPRLSRIYFMRIEGTPIDAWHRCGGLANLLLRQRGLGAGHQKREISQDDEEREAGQEVLGKAIPEGHYGVSNVGVC